MAGPAQGQATIEWRRLAADKHVSQEIARGLWEQAQAAAGNDALARSNLFRKLLDDAAKNPTATPTPGKANAVEQKGPNDPASLGPGKTTQVLLDKDKKDAKPPVAPPPVAAPAGKDAAIAKDAAAPGAEAKKPDEPPTAKPTVDKLRSDLSAAAQGVNVSTLIDKADPATIMAALNQIRAGNPALLHKIIATAGPEIEKRVGKKIPDPQADGPVGIKVPVVAGDKNQTHSVNDAGVPMIDAQMVSTKITEWNGEVKKRENDKALAQSVARVSALNSTATDQAKKAKLGDPAAKSGLEGTQKQLATELGNAATQIAKPPPPPPPVAAKKPPPIPADAPAKAPVAAKDIAAGPKPPPLPVAAKKPPPIPKDAAAKKGPDAKKAAAAADKKPAVEQPKKDPAEQQLEEFVTSEIAALKPKKFGAANKNTVMGLANDLGAFELGLSLKIGKFGSNPKVAEARAFIKDNRAELELTALKYLDISVSGKTKKPALTPAGYKEIDALKREVSPWQSAFNKDAAKFANGTKLCADLTKSIDQALASILAHRDGLLKAAKTAITGIDVNKPGTAIADEMAKVQIWVDAITLPDPGSLRAAVVVAKKLKEEDIKKATDAKTAAAAKEAESKKADESQPKDAKADPAKKPAEAKPDAKQADAKDAKAAPKELTPKEKAELELKKQELELHLVQEQLELMMEKALKGYEVFNLGGAGALTAATLLAHLAPQIAIPLAIGKAGIMFFTKYSKKKGYLQAKNQLLACTPAQIHELAGLFESDLFSFSTALKEVDKAAKVAQFQTGAGADTAKKEAAPLAVDTVEVGTAGAAAAGLHGEILHLAHVGASIAGPIVAGIQLAVNFHEAHHAAEKIEKLKEKIAEIDGVLGRPRPPAVAPPPPPPATPIALPPPPPAPALAAPKPAPKPPAPPPPPPAVAKTTPPPAAANAATPAAQPAAEQGAKPAAPAAAAAAPQAQPKADAKPAAPPKPAAPQPPAPAGQKPGDPAAAKPTPSAADPKKADAKQTPEVPKPAAPGVDPNAPKKPSGPIGERVPFAVKGEQHHQYIEQSTGKPMVASKPQYVLDAIKDADPAHTQGIRSDEEQAKLVASIAKAKAAQDKLELLGKAAVAGDATAQQQIPAAQAALAPFIAQMWGVAPAISKEDLEQRHKLLREKADAEMAINKARNQALTAKVLGTRPSFAHHGRLVIGAGFAAVQAVATMADRSSVIGVGFPEPWYDRGSLAMGQAPNILDVTGFVTRPWAYRDYKTDRVAHKYLLSEDFGRAIAQTQHAMDFVVVEGWAGGMECLHDQPPAKKNPPEWLHPDLPYRLTVKGAAGETKVYCQSIDVASGPGPGRMLSPEQMSPEHANQVEATKKHYQIYASGSDYSKVAKNGKVVVFGCSPSGAWAAQFAAHAGAKEIVWVGSHEHMPVDEVPQEGTRGKGMNADWNRALIDKFLALGADKRWIGVFIGDRNNSIINLLKRGHNGAPGGRFEASLGGATPMAPAPGPTTAPPNGQPAPAPAPVNEEDPGAPNLKISFSGPNAPASPVEAHQLVVCAGTDVEANHGLAQTLQNKPNETGKGNTKRFEYIPIFAHKSRAEVIAANEQGGWWTHFPSPLQTGPLLGFEDLHGGVRVLGAAASNFWRLISANPNNASATPETAVISKIMDHYVKELPMESQTPDGILIHGQTIAGAQQKAKGPPPVIEPNKAPPTPADMLQLNSAFVHDLERVPVFKNAPAKQFQGFTGSNIAQLIVAVRSSKIEGLPAAQKLDGFHRVDDLVHLEIIDAASLAPYRAWLRV